MVGEAAGRGSEKGPPSVSPNAQAGANRVGKGGKPQATPALVESADGAQGPPWQKEERPSSPSCPSLTPPATLPGAHPQSFMLLTQSHKGKGTGSQMKWGGADGQGEAAGASAPF
eukprot:898712-Rhodomonas_salina.1